MQGLAGGEDGVIIRCELDGTGVEIAADKNLSDPRVRPIPNIRRRVFCSDSGPITKHAVSRGTPCYRVFSILLVIVRNSP